MRQFHRLRLGIALVILSVLTYGLHYLFFHDAHHIFIYMVGDVGFVFIEVLLVTLIIDNLLHQHDKQNRLEKLNMVIGVFFSEIGTELLTYFSSFDPHVEDIRNDLLIDKEWSDAEFKRVSQALGRYTYQVKPDKLDLERLRQFLVDQRGFLLAMMENPNLIEHEEFTELLRSVFHLAEELKFRGSIQELPSEDLSHLAGDIDRAYGMLVREWLAYMQHLKGNFPYFFSLAMRTNPFDNHASVIVEW